MTFWDDFYSRLTGPEGCDFRETEHGLRWNCGGGFDKTHSRRLLAEMGLAAEATDDLLAFFEDHGGHCDCEVVMNVLEGSVPLPAVHTSEVARQ